MRQFGVPLWASARVFGHDPMSWYRSECGLGRASIVGTTIRVELPEHLLADEHHQVREGQRNSLRGRGDSRMIMGKEAGSSFLDGAKGQSSPSARAFDPTWWR
ncbi:MAG: hypothetical protein JO034_22985 [Singulisphaera sp.]|nr:hypothetical protein [Singulisphaera sp.]